MNEVTIIPTIYDHIGQLVESLREDDVRECESFSVTPFKGIWRSYRNSEFARTGFINGKIASIWGIKKSVLKFIGNPWLMTSDIVDDYPFIFARVYRQELKKMLERYEVLETWCDKDYAKSMRLLKIVGFKEDGFFPCDKNGRSLVRFKMDKS